MNKAHSCYPNSFYIYHYIKLYSTHKREKDSAFSHILSLKPSKPMESLKGLRWRGRTLKPIKTKRDAEAEEEERGGEEEEPLSPAARMFHEPDFNVYVIAIMGCKTKIYPEVTRANLGHTLLKHPRFSSLLVSHLLL